MWVWGSSVPETFSHCTKLAHIPFIMRKILEPGSFCHNAESKEYYLYALL